MTEILVYLETHINTVAALIDQFGFIASFLGVFFLGESAIIVLLSMSQGGELNMFEVILAASLATVAADTFWFSVGRYYVNHKSPGFIRKKFLSPVNSFLEKIIGGRFFSSLLLLKFLIGIRLILILHLARYPISWVRFILYDILGTLIYILILASISVYLSKFITSAIPAFHSLTTTLSGVLLIIILSAIAHQILLPKK